MSKFTKINLSWDQLWELFLFNLFVVGLLNLFSKLNIFFKSKHFLQLSGLLKQVCKSRVGSNLTVTNTLAYYKTELI